MKKVLNIQSVLLFAAMFFLVCAIGSCSKQYETVDSLGEVETGDWITTAHKKEPGNNDTVGLGLVMSSIANGQTLNFYGTFDANNEPKRLKSVAISNVNSNVVENYIVDEIEGALRITELYTVTNGIKDSITVKYNYSGDLATIVLVSRDWNTGKETYLYDSTTNWSEVGSNKTLGFKDLFFDKDIADFLNEHPKAVKVVKSVIIAAAIVGVAAVSINAIAAIAASKVVTAALISAVAAKGSFASTNPSNTPPIPKGIPVPSFIDLITDGTSKDWVTTIYEPQFPPDPNGTTRYIKIDNNTFQYYNLADPTYITTYNRLSASQFRGSIFDPTPNKTFYSNFFILGFTQSGKIRFKEIHDPFYINGVPEPSDILYWEFDLINSTLGISYGN